MNTNNNRNNDNNDSDDNNSNNNNNNNNSDDNNDNNDSNNLISVDTNPNKNSVPIPTEILLLILSYLNKDYISLYNFIANLLIVSLVLLIVFIK